MVAGDLAGVFRPALSAAWNTVSAATADPTKPDRVVSGFLGSGMFKNQRETVWVPVCAPVINVAQLVGVQAGRDGLASVITPSSARRFRLGISPSSAKRSYIGNIMPSKPITYTLLATSYTSLGLWALFHRLTECWLHPPPACYFPS